MQLQVSCGLAFVVLYLNNDPNITNLCFFSSAFVFLMGVMGEVQCRYLYV